MDYVKIVSHLGALAGDTVHEKKDIPLSCKGEMHTHVEERKIS